MALRPAGPRIVISNVYSDDNRGGAALTSAAIETARHVLPSAALDLITLIDDAGELPKTHRHTLRDHPEVTLRPALISRAGRGGSAGALLLSLLLLAIPRAVSRRHPAGALVAGSDLVMTKGGQMFRTRNISGCLSLWFAMYPLMLAARHGRPTVVLGQAYGPFAGDKGRGFTGRLLKRCDVLMLRDARSMSLAAEDGLAPPSAVLIPDTVFGLDPPSDDEREAVIERFGLAGVRFGVVTLATRGGEAAFAGKALPVLRQVVRGLLERGAVDALVVSLQTDGPTTSDRAGSEELVRQLDDERVALLDADLSWRELVALYSGAQFVIGGRVHSNIFALLGGTPPFPIDLSTRKAAEIFGGLGLGDRVLWLDEPIETLVRRVTSVLDDAEADRARLTALRDDVRKESWRARDHIVTLLNRQQ